MNTETTPSHTTPAEEIAFHSPLRFTCVLLGLTLLISAASGSLSALFLWSLDYSTALRIAHPTLLLALPLAGMLTVWAYRSFGREAGRGNDLVLEQIHANTMGVPARITPLIFGSSLLSHLFGASTGREGAAVQMGGGMAAIAQNLSGLPKGQYGRPLLLAGMAAGFASIFGTPLAGAVFAIEAPAPGRPLLKQLPIALLAALTGDLVCRAWGAHHAVFPIELPPWNDCFSLKWVASVLGAALLFGWAGKGFVHAQNGVRAAYRRINGPWWLPPLIGGLLICGISRLEGADSYLGLGVWSTNPNAVTITSAFTTGGANDWSWACKLMLTALSLGSGFKGGEVTPLFFIGATLGNIWGGHLHLAPGFFAALGLVAVFTGVAHTPLAGVFLAAELFGVAAAPWFAPVCWIAHLACGRAGLYPSQIRRSK